MDRKKLFTLKFFLVFLLFALVYFILAIIIDETCSMNENQWDRQMTAITQDIPYGSVKMKKAVPRRTEDIVMPKTGDGK